MLKNVKIEKKFSKSLVDSKIFRTFALSKIKQMSNPLKLKGSMNKISFESAKARVININGTSAVPTGVTNKNGRLYADFGEERIDLRRVSRQDLYAIIKMCMEEEQAAKAAPRTPRTIEEFGELAKDFYLNVLSKEGDFPMCGGFGIVM